MVVFFSFSKKVFLVNEKLATNDAKIVTHPCGFKKSNERKGN